MSQKKVPGSQASDALYEKAYIYYRRNQNAEALAELAKGDENEIRFMELKAQLFYRLERTEEALGILKRILEEHSDENDDVRRANYIAALVQLNAKQSGGDHCVPFELTSFEQMYNRACQLTEAEQYKEAVAMLDHTIEVCRETLAEDGLSEEEIAEELAIIEAQRGYCLQKMGRGEEALVVYKSIQRATDNNVKAVIFNNLLSVDQHPELVEARKELRTISKANRSKLSARQRQTIAFNMALIQLCPGLKAAEGEEVPLQKAPAESTTRKRKRKNPPPKNCDPSSGPPDPERWLPRHERSNFKKKRVNKKFKDKEIGKGTQGSAISDQQQFDYSKAPSAEPSSPKPPQPPKQQMKGGKRKKGKW